ncbi:MAG TPA: GNAT family N-acetyltransferase [Armatimonadota bacterium]|jgi:GNAT superfamily N-acetyltransferase
MSNTYDGPRACGPYELAPTLDLLNRTFFPEEARMGHFGPHLLSEANREQMRIIVSAGRPVAHAGLYVADLVTPRGELRLGGIFGVACAPDFRRQGLGEACVRDAMTHMQSLGCDLGWLGTGITDWYRGFGWESAGRGYSFELDRASVECLPGLSGVEVATGLWPDLPEMLALRAQDALGVRRTPEVMTILLADRYSALEVFTTAQDGRLVAYVAVRNGDRVEEHAGPPELVAGLIREVFHRRDDASAPTSTTNHPGRLLVETPVVDRGLSLRLRGLGLPYHYGYRGMYWVANLESLLTKLGLAEQIQFARTDGGYLLRRGAEQVDLSERHLAKLLLGPERVSSFAADLFPLEFYHWDADMV